MLHFDPDMTLAVVDFLGLYTLCPVVGMDLGKRDEKTSVNNQSLEEQLPQRSELPVSKSKSTVTVVFPPPIVTGTK